MHFRVKLNSFYILVTIFTFLIVVCLLAVGFFGFYYNQEYPTLNWMNICIGLLLLFYMLYLHLNRIRWIILEKDQLVLKSLLRKRIIKLNTIENIRAINFNSNYMVYGTRGVFGVISGNMDGYIYNISDFESSILILLKNGKRIYLSCENHLSLIKEIRLFLLG